MMPGVFAGGAAAGGGGGAGLAPDAIGAGANLTFWLDMDNTALLWKGKSTSAGNATADGDVVVRVDSAASIARCFYETTGDVGGMGSLQLAEISAANALRETGVKGSGAVKPVGAADPPSSINSFDLWTVSDAIIIWAGTVVDAGADTGSPWLNDGLLVDLGTYLGLHVYKSAGDAIFQAYNWAGAAHTATESEALNTPVVITLKHSGGQLSIRKNGGAWTSVASADTTSLSSSPGIGVSADVKIAQSCTYNAAISDANLLEVERYFGAKIGVTI